MAKIKDPQGKKVYRWEEKFTDHRKGKRLERREVLQWVRWASKLYGIKPPKVRYPTKQYRGTSYYDPNKHFILLRYPHMNVWVVLHEMAHAITDQRVSMDLPAHGQDWLGVFRVLLDKAMQRSVKQAGIKHKPLSASVPRKLRKRKITARNVS